MVNLLTNLTAAASAATLVGIFDFQKQNVLQFIYCDDFSPVSKLSLGSTTAPAIWTLVGGPLTFQIASNCAVNTFLTYPSGLSADAQHAPLVTRPGATTSWIIQLVNPTIPTGPWFILENISRKAITAWNGDPASANGRAPITLQNLNSTDTRQQFWFSANAACRLVANLHEKITACMFAAF
ncbi:hypothetical protein B0H19DRAFT_1084986 [Mycena capillaripes]|nr:hypothetical protein B0H19DRAFT_1084986 [Mycena capillaripes]